MSAVTTVTAVTAVTAMRKIPHAKKILQESLTTQAHSPFLLLSAAIVVSFTVNKARWQNTWHFPYTCTSLFASIFVDSLFGIQLSRSNLLAESQRLYTHICFSNGSMTPAIHHMRHSGLFITQTIVKCLRCGCNQNCVSVFLEREFTNAFVRCAQLDRQQAVWYSRFA